MFTVLTCRHSSEMSLKPSQRRWSQGVHQQPSKYVHQAPNEHANETGVKTMVIMTMSLAPNVEPVLWRSTCPETVRHTAWGSRQRNQILRTVQRFRYLLQVGSLQCCGCTPCPSSAVSKYDQYDKCTGASQCISVRVGKLRDRVRILEHNRRRPCLRFTIMCLHV